MSFWIQLSSGRGALECCRAAALIAPILEVDLNREKLDVRIIESIKAEASNTLRSITYSIESEPSQELQSKWKGTIQWRQQSPFRPNHKRKNWFIGVSMIELKNSEDWNYNNITLEAFKGSGAGGQHRNKNETAIRAVHQPTGTIAVANEERSRKMNERLALWRLDQKLKTKTQSLKLGQQYDRWNLHNQLIRGNPVQLFTGASPIKRIGR